MGMLRLRWKKCPAATGLSAVGAGPSSSEYHDGTTEYATVQAIGGGYGPVKGWFWYASVGNERHNSYPELTDEATAKKQAAEWVAAELAKEPT